MEECMESPVMTGGNTDEERALVEVASRGMHAGGEACSPFGWFGIAVVETDDEPWLAEECHLPMPEPGWYMVVQNGLGIITAMRAKPALAQRWFAEQSQAYQDWCLDLCED